MARKSSELVWGVRKEGKSLWSRNAVRGQSVRGERKKRIGRIEWRNWNPWKSKVAAAILASSSKPDLLLPKRGSTCLYLGASSGGTVSHIHDIVCGSENHLEGQVVAVEISPRMVRDLVPLSETRPGLVPVLGDARNIPEISPFLRSKASWIHQDLSMPDQAINFVKITSALLASGGVGLLSLKAASERASQGSDTSRFDIAEKILMEADLDLIEKIDISNFEDQHVIFVCKSSY